MKALTQFIETFIGYGSLQASTWFLGQEEAGVRDVEGLLERINVWQSLGCKSVVDVREFHQRLGVTDLFAKTPKIQRTWRRLIEIKLAMLGERRTKRSIGRYQAEELGKVGGDTLLGELMPLPKPSVTSWPYADLSNELPYMKTQKSYRAAIGPLRIKLLKDAIGKHQPQKVFFYGVTIKAAWEKIAGVNFEPTGEDVFQGSSGKTHFIVMKHPNTWGITQAYYNEIGKLVSEC